MTRLTDAVDQASGTPAPPAPTRSRGRCLTDSLADPRVRLGAGAAVLLVTAMAARRDHVGPHEAAAFREINGLPGSLHPPAWAIMQLGTLGAAPCAAGLAWLAGDRELAGRLLAGGTGAWALSKVVKRIVHRPRPTRLLPGTECRGREATGLGYLSGHAGVAAALGAAALPRLGTAGRVLTLSTVPVVGLTRIYVGAHLPLDVAGGAALGLIVDAAITLVSGSTAARPPAIHRSRERRRPPARTRAQPAVRADAQRDHR